jgi:hypothetical protein
MDEMIKRLTATALSLTLLAASARANNWLGPVQVETGGQWHVNVNVGAGCCCPQVPKSPWYTYFPYQAYVQTPGPTYYPYPPPAARNGSNGQRPAPEPVPAPPATGTPRPSGFQPVAYYPEAPGYWYGQ